MLNYRGYQLIEYVTVFPPQIAGKHGYAVRDELFGVLSDHKTMCNAKLWIDAQIEIANKMLTKVVGQHGED